MGLLAYSALSCGFGGFLDLNAISYFCYGEFAALKIAFAWCVPIATTIFRYASLETTQMQYKPSKPLF